MITIFYRKKAEFEKRRISKLPPIEAAKEFQYHALTRSSRRDRNADPEILLLDTVIQDARYKRALCEPASTMVVVGTVKAVGAQRALGG